MGVLAHELVFCTSYARCIPRPLALMLRLNLFTIQTTALFRSGASAVPAASADCANVICNIDQRCVGQNGTGVYVASCIGQEIRHLASS